MVSIVDGQIQAQRSSEWGGSHKDKVIKAWNSEDSWTTSTQNNYEMSKSDNHIPAKGIKGNKRKGKLWVAKVAKKIGRVLKIVESNYTITTTKLKTTWTKLKTLKETKN